MFTRVRTFLYQDIFAVPQPPATVFVPLNPASAPGGETVIQTTYIIYQSNFNVVNQQVAPVFQPVPFMESPVLLKQPKALLPWNDISFLQIAYTPSNWGEFSESPFQLKKSLLALDWEGRILKAPFVFRWGEFSESPFQLKKPNPSLVQWNERLLAPVAFTWGKFSESPLTLKLPKALLQWSDFQFTPTAVATPSFFSWGESPILLKAPARSEQPGFEFTPAAVATPSFFSWGESPFALKQPISIEQPGFEFTPAAVAVTGVFGSMPFIAREPVVFGEEFNVNQTPATVRTTPGPLVFSESPWEFKQSIRFEQQGFIFTPAAFTAFPWSESPVLLKKPIRFEQQGFRFTPAAFTISFSESPWQFKRPKALLPWTDISFLQIAYTPGFFSWSESPLLLKKPARIEQLGFQFTPTVATTPSALSFSESPFIFKLGKALLPWTDISFLQIAYTPGFFPWSESPLAFKRPVLLEQQPFELFTVNPATLISDFFLSESPILTLQVRGKLDLNPGIFLPPPPSVAPTPTVPKARIRHIIKDPWCEAEFIPMWLLTDGEPMDD